MNLLGEETFCSVLGCYMYLPNFIHLSEMYSEGCFVEIMSGSPLSPLLFTFFIEPLASAVRQNDSISGINLFCLFTRTSVNPPLGWFSSLNSTVNTFYWKGKRPRIKITTLQKPKQCSGLDAPNLYHYFLSLQLQFI